MPPGASSVQNISGSSASLMTTLVDSCDGFSLGDTPAMHRILYEIIEPLYDRRDSVAADRLFSKLKPETLERFAEVQEASWNSERGLLSLAGDFVGFFRKLGKALDAHDVQGFFKTIADAQLNLNAKNGPLTIGGELLDLMSSTHGVWKMLNDNPPALTYDEKHSELMMLATLLSPRNLLPLSDAFDDGDDRQMLRDELGYLDDPHKAQTFDDLLAFIHSDLLDPSPDMRDKLTTHLISLGPTRRTNLVRELTLEQRQIVIRQVDIAALQTQLSRVDFAAVMGGLSSTEETVDAAAVNTITAALPPASASNSNHADTASGRPSNDSKDSPSSFLQRVCPEGQQVMVSDSLYFGTEIPSGGTVSETQWDQFFEQEITSRFPLGSTAWRAFGQWMASDGVPIREGTMVVNFMHERTPEAEKAIHELQDTYQQRFQQEAVLRAWNEKCVSFNLMN